MGWLRNYVYSIGQQLMRQDPSDWLLYCALRPDRHSRLVTHPYYVKIPVTEDNIEFRQIDVNVGEVLITGRSQHIIQPSLSLDDETQEDNPVSTEEKIDLTRERAKAMDRDPWLSCSDYTLTIFPVIQVPRLCPLLVHETKNWNRPCGLASSSFGKCGEWTER